MISEQYQHRPISPPHTSRALSANSSPEHRQQADSEHSRKRNDDQPEDPIVPQDDVEPPYAGGQVRGCPRVLGCRFLDGPSWHPPEAVPPKGGPDHGRGEQRLRSGPCSWTGCCKSNFDLAAGIGVAYCQMRQPMRRNQSLSRRWHTERKSVGD